MDRLKIERILKENITILNIGKYEVNCYSDLSGVFLSVFKITEKGFFKISLRFIKYSDLKLAIHIKTIEDMIGPILHKATIKGSYIPKETFTTNLLSINKEKDVATNITTEHVKTEEDVIAVLYQLNDYIENVAEPFFEKWSDLRVLNDFIETIPQNKVGRYISNGPFSKAIIYKLCNNPKFDEYFNWLYDYIVTKYEANKDGDKCHLEHFKVITMLKEALDNVEPIYNV